MADTNRTEQATPKKKRDERKKGNVFLSKDASSIAILLVSFIILSKMAGFVAIQAGEFYETQIARIATHTTLTLATCAEVFRELILLLMICTLPLAGCVCLAAVAATGMQTRFNFSMEKLKPKFSKFNPLEGVKRIISIRSGVQLIKSILKVVVVAITIYSCLKGVLIIAPDMLAAGIQESTDYMVGRMMNMVYKVCIMFLALAVLDFGYEKFDYEKRMKMTKQEVKDEYKQTEGDPQIKGQRRERMRKMSMNRMIQAIPTADVIVRNPTHYAVAIRYDINKDFAPTVIAKGKDKVAERLLAEAEKYDILQREDRPLARTLYETVEIGEFIPQDLYRQVAEVMAWVYKVKEKEIS